MRTIVAGAGIGGLAAALALLRRGFAVTVFERSATAVEVGAGLQLSPNAMRVLAELGLDSAAEALGFEPETGDFRRHDTGRLWFQVPFKATCRARYGRPYINIHRADLHRLLLDSAVASGADLRLRTSVTGVRQDRAGVTVETDAGDATADCLVGADGLGSAVRGALFGSEAPTFTGQVAWRATVPAERVPRDLAPPSVTAWLGPGRHLVAYWLRRGTVLNLVAVEERQAWAAEGWRQPGDPGNLRRAFDGWAAAPILEAVEDCYLWGLHARQPMPQWTVGRVTLLGDACHPMLPFLAQGAAQALEDAAALARHLSAEDVAKGLAAYAAERRPRTAAIQRASLANARLFHLQGLARAKLTIAGYLPALPRAKLDRVYAHDAVAGAA